MDPISVNPALATKHDLLRSEDVPAPQLEPAPPELVSRFASLMSRAPEPGIDSIADTPGAQATVARAETHLKHHSEAIDNVLAFNNSEINLAQLQTMQIKTSLQLALLSMNQAAYMQVLGSTKSTVSALMKNQ